MLNIEYSNVFKKDLKRYKHRKDILLDLEYVMSLLTQGKPLLLKHRDHLLTGNWVDFRECHIRNDVLLIYKIEENTLFLTRLGSHLELF